MSWSLSDRDRGLGALVNRLRALTKATVKVGVLADRGREAKRTRGNSETSKGLTLLEVATVHEFGAPERGIPQRSFIRATVDEQESEIRAEQHALAVACVLGKIGLREALERLGARVAARIQARIARGIDPPNSPRTIARKGSSKPLIDTGQLRSSITWEVES